MALFGQSRLLGRLSYGPLLKRNCHSLVASLILSNDLSSKKRSL
jgi:hypothetical protein